MTRHLTLLAPLLFIAMSLCAAYAGEYTEYTYDEVTVRVPVDVTVYFSESGSFIIASFELLEDAYIYVSPRPLQIYVNGLPYGLLDDSGRIYVKAGAVEVYFGKPVVGEPPTGLFQYLRAGDFLGFIMAAWTLLLRQVFWVLPYFIIFVPLYIKTESYEYCAIVFILLSGFFLLFMPAETSAVAMVFLSLSLGFLLYKLVIKLIHWQ